MNIYDIDIDRLHKAFFADFPSRSGKTTYNCLEVLGAIYLEFQTIYCLIEAKKDLSYLYSEVFTLLKSIFGDSVQRIHSSTIQLNKCHIHFVINEELLFETLGSSEYVFIDMYRDTQRPHFNLTMEQLLSRVDPYNDIVYDMSEILPFAFPMVAKMPWQSDIASNFDYKNTITRRASFLYPSSPNFLEE